MADKALTQYLSRHAEPETCLLSGFPDACRYRQVLIVPAYREDDRFLQQAWQSDWFQDDVLIILVLNQPDNDPDITPQQQFYEQLRSASTLLWTNGPLSLLKHNAYQHCGPVLLVSRFQQPIPHRQGVGLARKIGTDLALQLIHNGFLATEWVACTDADACLPAHYFKVQNSLPDSAVAGCYAFKHVGGTPEVAQATALYEQALHYYVEGLKTAGSPYAYHALGSTLLFRAQAYAQVRGFPKRAAGEDFYLLNKLRKLGEIVTIEQATLCLQARLSDRVPFGTGVSTRKIMAQQQRGEAFCYYHPQVFAELATLLQNFTQLWAARTAPQQWLNQQPAHHQPLLQAAGLEAFVAQQAQHCRSKKQFDAQLMRWFDALKTLRFIHGLRDLRYPNQPMTPAPNTAHARTLPKG